MNLLDLPTPRFLSYKDYKAWKKGNESKAIYPLKMVRGVVCVDDRYTKCMLEEERTLVVYGTRAVI